MNVRVKEVQQLLVNLGEPIEVDDIWGMQSQAAMNNALRKTSGASQTQSEGTFWDDIKWFKRSEFRCPCGKCGGFPVEPEEKLVRIADQVREYFGKPMTISSGVRCQAHNDELPGSVSNSRHVSGKAIDFCVNGMSSTMVKVYVDQLVKQGHLRYCYCIDSGFVHMDIL